MTERKGKAWKELQIAITQAVEAAVPTEAAGQARLPRPSRIYSKMLASYSRRCIITDRVLPSAFLLRIQLARIPTTPPTLTFTPSLLHPRFTPPLSGPSAWLTCWNNALSLAAHRAAYRRLSQTAAWPTSFGAQVHSQLVRRVEQEGELMFERVRARSAWVKGEGGGRRLRPCPVRRLDVGEWERLLEEGHLEGLRDERGREIAAVVRFGNKAVGEPDEDRLSWILPLVNPDTLLPSSFPHPTAPVYSVSHFLDSAQLPPSASTRVALSARVEHWLGATVALFARRGAQPPVGSAEAAPAAPIPPAAAGTDKVYVIYAPGATGDRQLPTGDEDVAPLLQVLWRCRLWVGEGWEQDNEAEAEPDADIMCRP